MRGLSAFLVVWWIAQAAGIASARAEGTDGSCDSTCDGLEDGGLPGWCATHDPNYSLETASLPTVVSTCPVAVTQEDLDLKGGDRQKACDYAKGRVSKCDMLHFNSQMVTKCGTYVATRDSDKTVVWLAYGATIAMNAAAATACWGACANYASPSAPAWQLSCTIAGSAAGVTSLLNGVLLTEQGEAAQMVNKIGTVGAAPSLVAAAGVSAAGEPARAAAAAADAGGKSIQAGLRAVDTAATATAKAAEATAKEAASVAAQSAAEEATRQAAEAATQAAAQGATDATKEAAVQAAQAAEAARSTADAAKSAADAAKAAADTAKTTADAAKTAADTAQTTAQNSIATAKKTTEDASTSLGRVLACATAAWYTALGAAQAYSGQQIATVADRACEGVKELSAETEKNKALFVDERKKKGAGEDDPSSGSSGGPAVGGNSPATASSSGGGTEKRRDNLFGECMNQNRGPGSLDACSRQAGLQGTVSMAKGIDAFVKNGLPPGIRVPPVHDFRKKVMKEGFGSGLKSLLPADFPADASAAIGRLADSVQAASAKGAFAEFGTPIPGEASIATSGGGKKSGGGEAAPNPFGNLFGGAGKQEQSGAKADLGFGAAKKEGPEDVWHTGSSKTIFTIVSDRIGNSKDRVTALPYATLMNRSLNGQQDLGSKKASQ